MTAAAKVDDWNSRITIGTSAHLCVGKGKSGAAYVSGKTTSLAYIKDGEAVVDTLSSVRSGSVSRTLLLEDVCTGGI